MNCAEAQELITGFVDNELSVEERGGLELHLRECDACRAARAIEADLRKLTRRAAGALNASPDLKQNLSTLLDHASRRTPRQASLHWWNSARWQFAFVAAVLVLIVLPFLYFGREPEKSLAPEFFEIHRKALGGQMVFIEAKGSEDLVRRLEQATDGRFRPMGYDLSMLKLQPARGAVSEIGGRKVLVVVYRGEGQELTCLTFLGTDQDAPRAANLFFDPEKKINFHTFSDQGLNAVLHNENGVICVLISALPMQELLEAARAKARHA